MNTISFKCNDKQIIEASSQLIENSPILKYQLECSEGDEKIVTNMNFDSNILNKVIKFSRIFVAPENYDFNLPLEYCPEINFFNKNELFDIMSCAHFLEYNYLLSCSSYLFLQLLKNHSSETSIKEFEKNLQKYCKQNSIELPMDFYDETTV